MRRLIFWGSVISGVIAAYVMYRRGEPLGKIARQTVADPVGTLVSEMRNDV